MYPSSCNSDTVSGIESSVQSCSCDWKVALADVQKASRIHIDKRKLQGKNALAPAELPVASSVTIASFL